MDNALSIRVRLKWWAEPAVKAAGYVARYLPQSVFNAWVRFVTRYGVTTEIVQCR